MNSKVMYQYDVLSGLYVVINNNQSRIMTKLQFKDYMNALRDNDYQDDTWEE